MATLVDIADALRDIADRIHDVEHADGVQGWASVAGGYTIGAAVLIGWYQR